MKCSDCTDLFFLFLFFFVVFKELWIVREEVPSLLLGALAAKLGAFSVILTVTSLPEKEQDLAELQVIGDPNSEVSL